MTIVSRYNLSFPPNLSPSFSPSFSLQVLVALPKLERLDKEEFTEEERADAEEVYTHIPLPPSHRPLLPPKRCPRRDKLQLPQK